MNSICKIKIAGYIFNFMRITFTLFVLFLLLSNCGKVKQKYQNPYNVLNNWHNTVDKITHDTSLVAHFYGKFSTSELDKPCEVERWHQGTKYYKYKFRCEDFESYYCDNGDISWRIKNGVKVIDSDSSTIKKREISRLMRNADYLEKNSQIFSLKYSGLINHRDIVCHEVRISNNINEEIRTMIIDTLNNYRLLEKIEETGFSMTIEYFDFKEVNNSIFPFKFVMNSSERDGSVITIIDSIKIEDALSDSIFNFENSN